MPDFFRFPHTPHLAWLSPGSPRDDKVLPADQVTKLLGEEVVVEEKLDGANLGFSLGVDGALRAQNRGQYLTEPHAGQFARLPMWLAQHGDALQAVLPPAHIFFGEWCAARHSLAYTALPDWFLLFDVYDCTVGRFWSTARRNVLAGQAGLKTVPQIFHGKTSLSHLEQCITTEHSHYSDGAMEGVIVRRESVAWCEARAKLVRPGFTQAIDTHWSKRAIAWNRIDYSADDSTSNGPPDAV
jgi:ATP-dependent RNA circularization protein (DNA/RNA ligase family)